MSAQDDFNKEVVEQARRVVAAAGLNKLPLVMALRQIAVSLEKLQPADALHALDHLGDDDAIHSMSINRAVSLGILD